MALTKSKLKKLLGEGKINQSQYNEKLNKLEQKKKARKQNRKISSTQRTKEIVPQKQQIQRAIAIRPKKTPMAGMYNGGGNVVSTANPMRDYLMCLLDPKQNIARVPDSYNRPTAVYRSMNEWSVPIEINNETKGRFSLCCQPLLGDVSTPANYQIAMADPTKITANGTWDTIDWSNATSYVSNDTFGNDPRVDVNTPFMTAGIPSSYGAQWQVATSPALATDNLLIPVLPQPFATNLGTPPTFYDKIGPAAITNGYGTMRLSGGEYLISIEVKFTVSVLPAGNVAALTAGAFGFNNNIAVLLNNSPSTPVTATGQVYTVAATFNVSSNSASGAIYFRPRLSNSPVLGSPALTNATISTVYLSVSTTSFGGSTPAYLDNGIISEVRPVAMSLLVSYMGTELNNGGEISIAWVPNETAKQNFFGAAGDGGQGQLQYEENVRKLDRAYNGPIKNGAYCIWSPYDTNDLRFVKPSQMASQNYPAIICSGVFNPDAAVINTQMIMRVELCVVFEFVTKYTMFELVKCPGSQALIDNVFTLLSSETYARANGKHWEWIKAMATKVGKFYQQNSHLINPLMSALALTTGL